MRFRDKLRLLFSNSSTLTDLEEWLIEALGGKKSKAGITVTPQNALKVTAAYACVNVLSATVACTPFNVYEPAADGGRQKARDHPVQKLLNRKWNEYLTAFRGWRVLMVNALLTEAGYIEIVRKKGRPVELYPIPTKYVTKYVNKRTLRPEYHVYIDGEEFILPYNNVIEIPGLADTAYAAYDPISLLREALGLSMAAEEFGAEYFSEGTHPSGILTYPGALKSMKDDKFRSEVRSSYTGLGKKNRLMILEEGLKFEKIAVSPNEGQMTDSRKFQVTEIARFFNVPPHKIMDLDRATWSNIEEMNLSFIQDTIMPWIKNIEQALCLQLILLSEEEKGLYIEADLNAHMRGRILDRYSAYQKGVMYGWLSPNDVRKRENEPTIPGGDSYYIPQNLMKIGQEVQKGGNA